MSDHDRTEQDVTPIDDGSRQNDLEPSVDEAPRGDEPETWGTGDAEVPIEVAAPDWQEQQVDAVPDSFDDETDRP